MNEISFTGLSITKVAQKCETLWGAYLPPNHAQIKTKEIPLKHGEKHYRKIIIECDLTDDTSGKDFTEYMKELIICTPEKVLGKKHTEALEELKSLGTIANLKQLSYINPQNPNHVRIYMDRFDVEDELGCVTEANFELNNRAVLLNRQSLPLYTIMATISKKLQALQGISKEKSECLDFVNKSVHQKAVDFIDNIM